MTVDLIPPEGPPSTDIVRRAASGALDGLGAIYNYYFPIVCRWVVQDGVPYADREDVAQDVFLKGWRSLPILRDFATLPGFLRTIARRTALNYLRNLSRRPEGHLNHPPCGLPDGELAEFFVRIFGEDISADVIRRLGLAELGRAIDAAILKLPQQQRVAFELRYLEGWEISEIAVTMRITENAVSILLHRAREKFKQELFRQLAT